MRRSRLSCPDVGSQFRARSTSPGKSRNVDLRSYTSSRSKNRPRSPSPGKSVIPGRRSILECDVNPYELMSTDEKKDVTASSGQKARKARLDAEYEDVDVGTVRKSMSHIPKLQQKTRKLSSAKKIEEKEGSTVKQEAKFKSILKKPNATFGDTDSGASGVDSSSGSASSKSGSHFYLPMPTSSPARKKVQFLVENELVRGERNNEWKEIEQPVAEAGLRPPPPPPQLKEDVVRVDGNKDLDTREIAANDSVVLEDDEEGEYVRYANEQINQEGCIIFFKIIIGLYLLDTYV